MENNVRFPKYPFANIYPHTNREQNISRNAGWNEAGVRSQGVLE